MIEKKDRNTEREKETGRLKRNNRKKILEKAQNRRERSRGSPTRMVVQERNEIGKRNAQSSERTGHW